VIGFLGFICASWNISGIITGIVSGGNLRGNKKI
jgi:hypothetical protein